MSTALSYVTGSHNFKTGFQWSSGMLGGDTDGNADLQQRYTNGVPEEVEVKNWPVWTREHVKADIGVFVQDAWTIKRLTVSPGVRLDHFNAQIDEQSSPAGRFAPARYFPERPNLPNWNDIAPRFGVIYDTFGNGKTAVKFGVNKYMNPAGGSFPDRYNPLRNDTDRRDWDDCAYHRHRDLQPARRAPGYHDDIAQDNGSGRPTT